MCIRPGSGPEPDQDGAVGADDQQIIGGIFLKFENSVYFIEKLELLSEKAKHFYDDYLEAGNVNFLWQGFTNCIKSLGILNFSDNIEHEQ